MTNFKINKNKKDLPDELINKHKDFGKIMANHQKVTKYKDATKPLYKNPGFMSFIVILFVVTLTFILTDKENENKESTKDSTSVLKNENKQIEEPINIPILTDSLIKDATEHKTSEINKETSLSLPEVKTSIYKIDPKKGAVIYHGSTRILIPSLAFKDATGGIIQNEVDITYREFKDPVDMFLANIPMHYDSTQKGLYNLESAGMFEMKGYSGKQIIYLNKPITVEMATPEHGKNYNTYFYNEKIKKWEYIERENQVMRFMVQADEKQYPELKPFKNLIWEFAINDQQKDVSAFRPIFSKTWGSFSVSEAAVLNTKDVKLKQNSSEPKFFAHPISLLNDAEANKRLLKAKFDEHYSLLKKKEKQEADLEDALKRQQEWMQSPQGKAYISWSTGDIGQRQIRSSSVATIINVVNFGIWNCDHVVPISKEVKINASFVDQHGKKLNLQKVHLMDYFINSVFTFSKGEPLRFNNKSDKVMWALLPENKLAIYSKVKFYALTKLEGNFTFTMEVVDINGMDITQIKALLAMHQHRVVKAEIKDKDPIATYKRIIQLKKPIRENDLLYSSETSKISKNGTIKDDSNKKANDALKGVKIPKF
jgi:hypothetical protein